jgi:hypothetical protein
MEMAEQAKISTQSCPDCGASLGGVRSEAAIHHERYGVDFRTSRGYCEKCNCVHEFELVSSNDGEGWYIHKHRRHKYIAVAGAWEIVNRIEMPCAPVLVGPGAEYDVSIGTI